MSAVRLAYPISASCRVFKSGSSYIAQTIEGEILSTSTTDASVVINAAINNIPGAAARQRGGKVFIHAGDYDCKTMIEAKFPTTGYHGVQLEGEGLATMLHFTPSSSLPDAVRFSMNYPALRNLSVWANENVINLVKCAGPAVAEQYNWGVIENVGIYGKNSGIPQGSAGTIISGTDPGTGQPWAPIPGQVGIFLHGNHSANGYFVANWKIHNVELFSLDYGCIINDHFADMCNHSNVHIGGCNVGYLISGVQHNLVNFRIEGAGGSMADKTGTTGIWIKPGIFDGLGGNVNFLTNINVELHKANSQGILIENNSTTNEIVSTYNSSADDMTRHTVIEQSKTPGLNNYNQFLSLPSVARTRRRSGTVHFGMNKTGFEGGILAGNVSKQKDGVTDAFTTLAFANGPMLNLTTASTANSVACVFYNNSDGNRIYVNQYPSLFFRFLPNSLTGVRIFMGLWSQFTAPTGSSDLLANRRGIGMYLDTSVSSNWKIMHNDNSVSSTIADFPTLTIGDLTYGPTAITGFINYLTVAFNNTNPSAHIRHHGCSYDYKTTGIPTGSTPLGFLIYIENVAGGGTKTLRLFDMEMAVTTV